jgi:spermidine/putrescine ABC transporter ATP-binding subunit
VIDLELRNVVKRYGDFVAVKGVSLEVQAGELLTLLGPSGCGKTTLLRILTGFLAPDEGEIVIRGQVVNDLPPHRRDTAMVYQSYALFPHMTIFDNVAFGLRMRRLPKADIQRRVGEALELVRLDGLERRFPGQLSGGQQQRVALARALVVRPSVLLLDEPLSNLDAKLREQVRGEIRQLQQTLGITTVFVTHDQAEALALSDRIAVMNHGRVEQVGTPAEIYEQPATTFVVDFIGRINLLEGEVFTVDHDAAVIRLPDGLHLRTASGLRCLPGERVAVGIRPEQIVIGAETHDATAANVFRATVENVTYLGESLHYRVRLGPNVALTVIEQNRQHQALPAAAPVAVSFDPAACLCLRP